MTKATGILACCMLFAMPVSDAIAGKYVEMKSEFYGTTMVAYQSTLGEVLKCDFEYMIYDFDLVQETVEVVFRLLDDLNDLDCSDGQVDHYYDPVMLKTAAGEFFEVPISRHDPFDKLCVGKVKGEWLKDQFEVSLPVTRGPPETCRFKTKNLDLMKLAHAGTSAGTSKTRLMRHEVVSDQTCANDFECPNRYHCDTSKERCVTIELHEEEKPQ